jgi:sec-independent protein translocase protein TatA
MGSFSLIHWIILGLVLLLLFGGNRFSNMMKDVAKGMKSFKEGMADDEDEKRRRYEEQRRAEPPRLPRDQGPIDVTARREEPTAAPPPPRDDEAR